MNQLGKWIKNESGVTLLELLVALSVSSIILSAIYGTFLTGVKVYKKIAIEAQLRDEADYIVANLLNVLYENHPDHIVLDSSSLKLFNYKATTINQKEVIENTFDESISASIIINVQNKLSDTGALLGEEIVVQTKDISNTYSNQILNSNHIVVNNINSNKIIDFTCSNPMASYCNQGIITIQFSISDSRYNDPNSMLYVEPIEFISEFGY
ncbi:prepilin-type N-terminal cleavage/methylation domain-containing protein [Bacillus sp. HMF5848]|uniref:PilW family protein n=1 Tax=Bacillus sp. HMF5848 TaxID=2495421 RepID=UPI000F79DEF7|nr:prepilin-type N-terminal cleavage/methylation domain-containing protein [Bacillus sp. HMF5848]RSK28030.1 prepilin-type N-terminal cleavage/methylation domain-containing protein [Bacillus sp. HMF5848]